MSDPQTPPLYLIDGRCGCARCVARTGDIYRMVSRACVNCGAGPFLIIYRASDPAADQDCPTCGRFHSVAPKRLATPDEIPSETING